MMPVPIPSASSDTRPLRRHLAEFGFSTPDIDLYLALLSHAAMTFQGLLRVTRLAPETARGCVQRLALLQLVAEDIEDGKPHWHIVGRAVADRVASSRAALAEKIRSLAAALYAGRRPDAARQQRVHHSADRFALACSHALMGAKRQVIAVERRPRLPQTALFWPAIIDATMRGVKYVRYASVDEIFLHGFAIVTRDVEALAIDLRIVPSAAIPSSLYLVDDTALLLFTSATAGSAFSARVSRNPDLINRYRAEKLAPMMAAATPFNLLKAAVQHHIEVKRARLAASNPRADAIEAFDAVAALGKFARLSTAARGYAVVMVQAGILEPVGDGFSVSAAGDAYLETLL